MEHLYFYHIVKKGAILNPGITSLLYQYNHGDMDSFLVNSDKYRHRLCVEWGYYPNKRPSELSPKEIIQGLIRYRGPKGANYIYLFRFPPFSELGSKMGAILRDKDLYRIDIGKLIDDGILTLDDISWGHEMSNNDNPALDMNYYKKVSVNKYFKLYSENLPGPLFASMNHIGISPKGGYIPKKYCEKINMPRNIQDVKLMHMKEL